MYVTKAKSILYQINGLYRHELDQNAEITYDILNGKIVAEFECDKVEEITFNGYFHPNDDEYTTNTMNGKELMKSSCLDLNDLINYLEGTLKKRNVGYAIHIKNLKMFDKPIDYFSDNNIVKQEYRVPKRPSQNMCYCYYKGEKCVLISYYSEDACNILNGKKTIDIRKQIVNALKELIK